MTNQNGQLILQALQNFDEPVPVKSIVNHIADTAGVHPNDVKESVQETLNGGVRYGYIQRSNRKYYAAPVDLGATGGEISDIDGDTEKKEPGSGELEDRSGSRKKRKGGRSRSSRRRSGSKRGGSKRRRR